MPLVFQQLLQLIAKDVNLSPDLLLKVLAKFDFNPTLQPTDIEDLKTVEVFMKNNAIIKSHVNIDAFADPSLTREHGIK